MYYITSEATRKINTYKLFSKACREALVLSAVHHCTVRVYRLMVEYGKLLPVEEAQFINGE